MDRSKARLTFINDQMIEIDMEKNSHQLLATNIFSFHKLEKTYKITQLQSIIQLMKMYKSDNYECLFHSIKS